MIGSILSGLASRAGLLAIAFISGFWLGHNAASRGEAVRYLENENAALRATVAAREAAAKVAADEASKLRAHWTEMQGVLDAYEKELSEREDGNTCELDSSDIERLRKLR